MLKFRRTKNSATSSNIFSGVRMKKVAPPPPPSSGGSVNYHSSLGHDPDDCAINELLEGRMELEVVLPGEKTVKMTVERRVPMMDLLVQVTSAHKINPGGHVIHVMTDRGLGTDSIHYKPNTPIGTLDASRIHVVPKTTVVAPPVKKRTIKLVNQPFEQTFRLQVNLPRNQLAVLRVSAKDTLADILRLSCEEKSLDANKYDLRHPNHLDEQLDLQLTLSQYSLNEISLVSKSTKAFRHSTSDILNMKGKDDKKKKGWFGFQWKTRSKSSLDSHEDPNSRGASPTRSDSSGGGYTCSDVSPNGPNRPISYHEEMIVTRNKRSVSSKKRQAPPPPPPSSSVPGTSQENSVHEPILPEESEKSRITAPKVSHSRQSSDSSGYHEASVLSDACDSMPQTQSSSPTSSLVPAHVLESCNIRSSSYMESSTITNNLKNSISCPNVSVSSTVKKRKAPLPPPKGDDDQEMDDIDAGLHATAMQQIEECSKEIAPDDDFYDYQVNYEDGKLEVEAHIPPLDTPNGETQEDDGIIDTEKYINDHFSFESVSLQSANHDYMPEVEGEEEEEEEEITPKYSTPDLQTTTDEKIIFTEEPCVDASFENNSEEQFFAAVKDISSNTMEETEQPKSNDVIVDSMEETKFSEMITESKEETNYSEVITESVEEKTMESSITSSESSMDSQISVVTIQRPESPVAPKLSFSIGIYGSATDVSLISSVQDTPAKLTSSKNRFSSMQDLHNCKIKVEPTKELQEVDNTMRKVQSEISLMVSQNKSDKDAEVITNWKKESAVEPKLGDIEEAKTIDPVQVKGRPIRHKPSIKIGTWSEQKSDVIKEYKTEIKIQSEEIESAPKVERSLSKKPSFQISHSKMDTNIYPNKNGLDSPKSSLVPKTTTVVGFTEKPKLNGNTTDHYWRSDRGSNFSQWYKGDKLQATSPIRIIKKRGVTTNNRGELVVKESKYCDPEMEFQNRAIQEAKTLVMEQVKNRVMDISPDKSKPKVKSNEVECVYRSPDYRAKRSPNKVPLVESNFTKRSENEINGNNVYINVNNIINKGFKENINSKNDSLVSPPPPPPPVPNMKMEVKEKINLKSKNGVVYSRPLSFPSRRTTRKVIEPEVDSREELMIAIRSFGGRNSLSKV